jgi:hypothetical protein
MIIRATTFTTGLFKHGDTKGFKEGPNQDRFVVSSHSRRPRTSTSNRNNSSTQQYTWDCLTDTRQRGYHGRRLLTACPDDSWPIELGGRARANIQRSTITIARVPTIHRPIRSSKSAATTFFEVDQDRRISTVCREDRHGRYFSVKCPTVHLASAGDLTPVARYWKKASSSSSSSSYLQRAGSEVILFHLHAETSWPDP